MHKKLNKPSYGTTNLHKRSETWVWGLTDAFPLCGDTHPFMWLNYGFISDTKTNPVLMVDAANNCILLASEMGIPSHLVCLRSRVRNRLYQLIGKTGYRQQWEVIFKTIGTTGNFET